MTRRGRFTQADIIRAVKAFHDAGMDVGAVRIEPDGSIVVMRAGYERRDLSPDADWREGSPLYAGRDEKP